jgi:hypothetical protein
MTRLALALRFLLVGPEFLVVCVGLLLTTFSEAVSNTLPVQRISDEVLKYLALLPMASTAWILTQGRGLLFPEKDKKHVLQDWPDYWKVKYGFNVALFYSVLFSFFAIGAWVAEWNIHTPYPQIALITALLGAAANFLSCYYGRIEQDEALAKLKSD